LAYNFNDETVRPPGGERHAAPAGSTSPATHDTPPAPASPEPPQSAGFARFNSCRWQQPQEDGNAAFCTHREVKPYAGTAGFDADAWCPECQYFKLRRAPKKRTPSDDYSY
jgi:hypothetical protein